MSKTLKNMDKQTKTAIILIILVGVLSLGLLRGRQPSSEGDEWTPQDTAPGDELSDDVFSRLGRLIFGGGDAVTLATTIHYEDGSSRKVDPSTDLMVSKLAITDYTGKAISKLEFTTKLKVSWEGEMESFNLNEWTMYYEVDSVSKDYDKPTFSGNLKNGEWVELGSVSVSASEMMGWGDIASGTHTLKARSYVVLEITFTDGNTDTDNGYSDSSLQLKWGSGTDGKITALSVSVSKNAFY